MSATLKIERVEVDGLPLAVLTLCDLDKRNALSPGLLGELREALAALEGEVRAVVLTGAGDQTFCSGYDITALPEEPDDAWLRDHGPLGPALRALRHVPTVAALNGAAIGAGLELALTCDLRVAHGGVTLRLPPVRLGVVYTPEGILRLRALCGEGRARELLLCARTIDAGQALSWGLLSRVVAPGEVRQVALELAAEMARGMPLAVRGTKQVMDALLAEGPQLSERTADEILALRRVAWNSAEARAARRAFAARSAERARQGKA